MSTRFFAPDLPAGRGDYLLEGDEAHHLRIVCRGRVGDKVELFDGQGRRASAEVVTIDRHSVYMKMDDPVFRGMQAGTSIATAIPKGDRATVLIEKCTELGVSRLVPLQTDRSVTDPKQGKQAKWERTVIESCKQCGRDQLMSIDTITQWRHIARETQSPGWLLHIEGDLVVPSDICAKPSLVAIGPEGGWTEEELALARNHGWRIKSIPGNILRVETAVIAIAALLAIGPQETLRNPCLAGDF